MGNTSTDGGGRLPDPWWLQRWAREVPDLDTTSAFVLSLLAEACDYNTASCHPSQATVARWARCSERTAHGRLVKLEEAGLIARRHRARIDGRTSDEILLLAPGIDEWPDGTRVSQTANRACSTPEQSQTATACGQSPTASRSTSKKRELARERARRIPNDFPDELRPHAREAMLVLRAVAEQHGAREVTALGVARAIMAHPRHPLVKVAHDLAVWAADPPRPVRDVVSTYRTFLEHERPLAATERLDAGGLPAAGAAARPGNVQPIRRPPAEAARLDRQARRFREAGLAVPWEEGGGAAGLPVGGGGG